MNQTIQNGCPHCGAEYSIDHRAIGTVVPCPTCGDSLTVTARVLQESSGSGFSEAFPGMIIGAVLTIGLGLFVKQMPFVPFILVHGVFGAVAGARIALAFSRKSRHWWCSPWIVWAIPQFGLGMLFVAFSGAAGRNPTIGIAGLLVLGTLITLVGLVAWVAAEIFLTVRR